MNLNSSWNPDPCAQPNLQIFYEKEFRRPMSIIGKVVGMIPTSSFLILHLICYLASCLFTCSNRSFFSPDNHLSCSLETRWFPFGFFWNQDCPQICCQRLRMAQACSFFGQNCTTFQNLPTFIQRRSIHNFPQFKAPQMRAVHCFRFNFRKCFTVQTEKLSAGP